jgi:DNA-binding response OmpR family regulator
MEKKKILIVEDDMVLQKTLGEFLVSEGFETIVASDGEEAVEVLTKEVPDLILLDIILPKKDGYEVIKEVRANERMNDIPIILLTNLGSVQDVEKALDLGATTYLVKADYTLEEVVTKIKSTLGIE